MDTSSFSITSVVQYVMSNPALYLAEAAAVLLFALVLFLLLYALRDILLRTRSFWYQCACIVIVTLLPIIGFFIYLLIRPARTLKQRELESMLLTLVASETPSQIEVGETKEPSLPSDAL